MQGEHVVLADGSQEWWHNGQRHREGDQPAVIRANGTQEWWRNGQPHREGDKPAIISASGTQLWLQNSQRHREGDQPAVVFTDGTQEWWWDGVLHREGGKPAVVCADGMHEWWIHDTRTRAIHVADFRESSDRFALVRAVVAIGVAACEPCDTGSALSALLRTVHALPCDASSSYHVAHEHAFLVALFL